LSQLEPSPSSEHSGYWTVALKFYARAASIQSAVAWVPGLLLPPVFWLLHGAHLASLGGLVAATEFGGGIGAAFFLGMFGAAIASDISRNWGKSERELDWNPLLFWRVFLYLGSLMFAAAGFASYRLGWSRSLEFGAFAVLCWLGAGAIGGRIRLPKKAEVSALSIPEVQSGHEPRKRHWAGGHLHEGFVAMEYFALILNRSYLVFITEAGLRGWRFRGVVSSLEPMFYENAEALLDDPDLAEGSARLKSLCSAGMGSSCVTLTSNR